MVWYRPKSTFKPAVCSSTLLPLRSLITSGVMGPQELVTTTASSVLPISCITKSTCPLSSNVTVQEKPHLQIQAKT